MGRFPFLNVIKIFLFLGFLIKSNGAKSDKTSSDENVADEEYIRDLLLLEEYSAEDTLKPTLEAAWIREKLRKTVDLISDEERKQQDKIITDGELLKFLRHPTNALILNTLFDEFNNETTKGQLEYMIEETIINLLENVPDFWLTPLRDIIKLEYISQRLELAPVEDLILYFELSPELKAAKEQKKLEVEERLFEKNVIMQRLLKTDKFDDWLEREWISQRIKKAIRDVGEFDDNHTINSDDYHSFLENEGNAEVLELLFEKLQVAKDKQQVDFLIEEAIAKDFEYLPDFWVVSNHDLIKLIYLQKFYDNDELLAVEKLFNDLSVSNIQKYFTKSEIDPPPSSNEEEKSDSKRSRLSGEL